VTTKQAQGSATAAALNAAAPTAPGSSGPASAAGSTTNLQQQQQSAARGAQQQQQQQLVGLGGGGNGSTGGIQAAVPAGNAAQELRLHVPAIGARLDSRQFEVLMDVIQNIAMAPLPAVGRSGELCQLAV